MKIWLPPTLSFKSFVRGALALYLLGIAVCWDTYRLNPPKKSDSACCKKPCCETKGSCKPAPKPQPKPAPDSPKSAPCDCQQTPTSIMLWRDNITAYQIQEQESKKLVEEFSSKALTTHHYQLHAVANLPTSALPTTAGKELLRHLHKWQV